MPFETLCYMALQIHALGLASNPKPECIIADEKAVPFLLTYF